MPDSGSNADTWTTCLQVVHFTVVFAYKARMKCIVIPIPRILVIPERKLEMLKSTQIKAC